MVSPATSPKRSHVAVVDTKKKKKLKYDETFALRSASSLGFSVIEVKKKKKKSLFGRVEELI